MAKDRALIAPERWRRILWLMDETFDGYLTGLVALRKCVVADLKHKLTDSEVLNH